MELSRVDIRAELEVFPWQRAEWKSDRLLACSPFRYDTTPSFYVYLTDTPTAKAGSWGDSGASDPRFQRGGFVSLLSFLRQETVGETLEYLAWKYGEGTVNPDELTLNLTGKFRIERNRQALDAGMLEQYRYRHPYLESRGISESVQRLMQIGFDRNSNAITIPWFNADGTLANVKYRTVNGKMFWYAKNSLPIRNLVYGIDVIYRKQIKRAAIVEAEIDAMYLMSAGIPAVATGGSAFNEIKRDLIVKSPLEEIVIMADHDEAGQKLKRKTIEMLAPYVRVKVAGYPMRYKDANEIGEIAEVRRYINKARQVRSLVRIKT